MITALALLCSVLLQVTLDFERLQREHKIAEEKLEEMSRNKDSVAHWEAQIAEIIQW